MSLPSVDVIRSASEWYVVRYRSGAVFVDVFLWNYVDAMALASLIEVSYSTRVQVWYLSLGVVKSVYGLYGTDVDFDASKGVSDG